MRWLWRIGIGKRDDVHALARARDLLEHARRDMPVSGVGVYADAYVAIDKAIGAVKDAERRAA